MTQQKYELQTLLKQRQSQKDEAQLALKMAQNELVALRDKLAQTQAAIKKGRSSYEQNCEDHYQNSMYAGMPAKMLQDFEDYCQRFYASEATLLESVESISNSIDDQRRYIHAARVDLLRASQQLKVVELDHKKWLDTQKSKSEKVKENQMDELASRIWSKLKGD